MAVSKRLRYEILRRDGHKCRYCGAGAPDVPLRVDHVTPVALGGSDEPSNLVTSCEPCNSGKTSSTPDAALVAGVSDDALRWAAAMKQAASELSEQQAPKVAYRESFKKSWTGWTRESGWKTVRVDLPDGWKGSLDAFYEAGLPQELWPDIIEKAMTNPTVKVDNTFRYACGIAWRKVRELHDRARAIVGEGQTPEDADSQAAVFEAAFAVWFNGLSDNDDRPSAAQVDEFRRSLAELSDWDLTDPGRIVDAAHHATFYPTSDIARAMRDMDHDRVSRAWIGAWPREWEPADQPWNGGYAGGPSEEATGQMKEQIEKLLEADIYVERLVRAATHAGIHKSARLYQGLTDDELKVTGVTAWRSRAAELWRVAYTASAEAEPSREVATRFFSSLDRIVEAGGFYVADVHIAAAAAGSYQDPDLTTCLPRSLSALEAAMTPMQGAAS